MTHDEHIEAMAAAYHEHRDAAQAFQETSARMRATELALKETRAAFAAFTEQEIGEARDRRITK